MTRRRVTITIAVITVVVITVGVSHNWSRHSPTTPAAPVTTTQVRRMDLIDSQLVNGTLGWAPVPPVIVRRGGTWTDLPAPGTTIGSGQAVASIDTRPVIMLTGSTPAWRAIGPATGDGADVEQLEAALVELGFDPRNRINVDGHITSATVAAIDRWQTSLGEEPTGTVDDGDVVFEPASLRVGQLHAQLGAPAQVGDSPFTATGTTRIGSVSLPPGREHGIAPGTQVSIDLLDGSSTAGSIEEISPVATTSDAQPGQPGTPSLTMTVALQDPTAGGNTDDLPVQVHVTTATRTGVLAVPITALLALAEGGYGLEVVAPDGTHRVVAVTPGLFTSSMVEITTGDGITDGTTVVTAR